MQKMMPPPTANAPQAPMGPQMTGGEDLPRQAAGPKGMQPPMPIQAAQPMSQQMPSMMQGGPKGMPLPSPINAGLQTAWRALGRQNSYQAPSGYVAPQISRRAVVPMSWAAPTPAPTQAPVYNGGEFDRSFMY